MWTQEEVNIVARAAEILPCICQFSEIRLLEGYISYLVVKYTQSQCPQIPERLTLHFRYLLQLQQNFWEVKKYCKNLMSQKKKKKN